MKQGGEGLEAKDQKILDEILESHSYDQTAVIGIMQDIQKVYRYLPEEMLCYIAKKLHLSEAKVYGVATFYENFSLEPKGKYIIKICDGTACHVRQSTAILDEIRGFLGVTGAKPTTEDMMFTVETVSCLGACGLAPVCTVNDVVHPAMTPEKARALIQELKESPEAGEEANDEN
ncbi:NADH-quinone oxidoreductase subunit NuoE family protein [Petralouisia muris]|uniref:NADH-quinone oxidoreductase subunit NuoE family protein n=1 Tax=Petralouisia muris TaxID=3032872 RepID=UPI0023B843E6|nr:NAD(P)H-dependent oxidoreductase subunit E [Petralouisia muris]